MLPKYHCLYCYLMMNLVLAFNSILLFLVLLKMQWLYLLTRLYEGIRNLLSMVLWLGLYMLLYMLHMLRMLYLLVLHMSLIINDLSVWLITMSFIMIYWLPLMIALFMHSTPGELAVPITPMLIIPMFLAILISAIGCIIIEIDFRRFFWQIFKCWR